MSSHLPVKCSTGIASEAKYKRETPKKKLSHHTVKLDDVRRMIFPCSESCILKFPGPARVPKVQRCVSPSLEDRSSPPGNDSNSPSCSLLCAASHLWMSPWALLAGDREAVRLAPPELTVPCDSVLFSISTSLKQSAYLPGTVTLCAKKQLQILNLDLGNSAPRVLSMSHEPPKTGGKLYVYACKSTVLVRESIVYIRF